MKRNFQQKASVFIDQKQNSSLAYRKAQGACLSATSIRQALAEALFASRRAFWVNGTKAKNASSCRNAFVTHILWTSMAPGAGPRPKYILFCLLKNPEQIQSVWDFFNYTG
jgi:hypothetical protein